MRKLVLLSLLFPFVAVCTYGCNEVPGEPHTVTADAATPNFAKDKPDDPKPELPVDCLDGQLITWDAASVTYVCADPPAVTRVTGDEVTVPVNETRTAGAHCPEGYFVTGGGYQLAGNSSEVQMVINRPETATLWTVRAKNEALFGDLLITAFAVCLRL